MHCIGYAAALGDGGQFTFPFFSHTGNVYARTPLAPTNSFRLPRLRVFPLKLLYPIHRFFQVLIVTQQVVPFRYLTPFLRLTRHPKDLLLASEVRSVQCRSILRKRDRRTIQNLHIMLGDIRLQLPHLVSAEPVFDEIYILFPDPWWKKRHKKRRIFTPILLEDFARTLIPSGQLYIASDVEEYFGVISAMVGENPAFRSLDDPAGRMERAGYVPTNFEVKMAGAGHPIHRAVYERV